jgi:acyl-CoA synthetase (AMP-forming)/AMP-acid ligase II
VPSPHTLRPAAPAVFVDDLAVNGEAPALFTGDGALTYSDLDRRVAERAEQLGTVRRLVAVEAANTVGALAGYLAALRGRHPVVLLPAGNDRSARRIVESYDPDVIMTAGSDWEVQPLRPGSAHELHPDLALLLSTSGTTGTAKLVRLSHSNLRANAVAIREYLGITAEDRAPTTLPMPYCYGLSVINSYLAAGAALVLTDESVVDRCFWDRFRASGATSLAGVPYTFELLDRVGFEHMALPSLRYVTQAGGRLAPAQVRRFAALGERDGWQFFVMYGQTEATARMAYLPPELAGRHPEAIGVAVPGGDFRLEPFGGGGADHAIGELVYSGPNVMLGYAEKPADLALGRTVEELRTGDIARRNSAGLYEVVGRRSRFVKPFGLRVDLDELERLVGLAGVTGLCTGDDQRIVIAVAGRGHGSAIGRLVADHIGLPPSRVVVAEVDELPRRSNGKPDYPGVLGLVPDSPPDSPPDFPPADPSAGIRALYAQVIGRPVADHESFVDAGGDSLSYVELSIGLEQLLGSLPAGWHTRPLGDVLRSAPLPRRLVSRVETSVVLRALSILLVVGSHTGFWHLRGGAHILLGVAGFNFAQFRLGAGSGLWRSVARVALPSMAWIGLASAVGSQLEWRHVFLVNHLVGGADSRVAYWFIESLVVILAVLGSVLAIPAVRRHERRHPFGTAVTVALLGLGLRLDFFGEMARHHSTSQPETVLWLFALGWAGAAATTTRQRLLVSLLLLPGLWGFWGAQPLREAIVGGGMLLLVWVPSLPIPRPVNQILGVVAGMSLALYLTHWQVYPPLLRSFGSPAAFAGSVAVGFAVSTLARRAVACRTWRRSSNATT